MTTSDDHATAAAEVFAGGGALGRLMSRVDWSATPLGPVRSWPTRLIEALRIILATKQPMVLFWGPELTMLYNEGYSAVLGILHPGALGTPAAEVFGEAWEYESGGGPLIRGVRDSRQPVGYSSRPFVFQRYGFLEKSYYDGSVQPLLLDDGQVGGVLAVVNETTARVLSERRLGLLADIGSRTAGLLTPQDVARAVAEVLQANREDVPLALLYLMGAPGELRLAASAGFSEAAVQPPESVQLQGTTGAAAGRTTVAAADGTTGATRVPGLAAALAPVVEEATPARLPGAYLAGPSAVGKEATALPDAWALPLTRASGVAGVLVVGVNPMLPATAAYREFLDVLASLVSAALSAAHAQLENRRRADELAELDRAKTAFFSNVSHEFRTPLTLMLGPVQQAIARETHPERRAELELAERNAQRLLKLVNTLLDVSRAEAGRLHAVFEPVDLAQLTAELSAMFRSAFELAGMELRIDCPPLPEPVHVDREMWEKIVLNLLSNALKFTAEGGVVVRMRAAGRWARLTVTDTGTGIPEEELPRLFERFHQVRDAESRSRSYEGSGIGLSLVKDLVELHAGTVSVTSRPDEGSEFTVDIPFGTAHLPEQQRPGVERGRPVRPPDPDALRARAVGYVGQARRWAETGPGRDADAAPSAEATGADTRPPTRTDAVSDAEPAPAPPAATPPGTEEPRHARVLVVDDNADMRSYLTGLLDPEYDVLLASDGQAALEAALARPVDLVLTDVMMPRLDGFALVQALRSHPRTTRLPIIMLTAMAGEEATVQGLETGADDYLAKPFSARQLLARVRANLELSRLREQVLEESRRHADMVSTLAQAGLKLSESLEPPQVLESAGEIVIPILADEIRIRLTDPRAAEPVFAAGDRVFDEELLDHALDAVITSGSDWGRAGLPATVLCAPLLSRGQVMGAVAIARHRGAYSQGDQRYLDALASRLALAYDNATRYQNERHLALTLQRALLPQQLPQTPGLRTASYYRASGTGAEIGGDWYDVIALSDGGMGLAIGDVMGHDVDAATVMGRLRSALRGLALDREPPEVILAKLDAYLRSLDVDHFATCLYAEYEPRTHRLSYASSGHLPPLMVAGERTGFLDVRPGTPLGLAGDAPCHHELELRPTAGLLLYTDGLVENHGLPLDTGLAALRRACATLSPPALADPKSIIGRALQLLDVPGRVDDDTALLAASVTPIA
ncbi:SpoIIE family protein phosphatase [Streptomyces jeddahensis]|uniref:histidine kinase n=1 Tax=Streptomyces jeddahensis TaxID=1716141 RepID=A0A177HPZ6_9ACTN|nr:SpoIIE family protein phosphatase [Streptomyces jeddahensis]OAH12975.1 sensor histidine kinase TodS [Streptomyces jeddahensis]